MSNLLDELYGVVKSCKAGIVFLTWLSDSRLESVLRFDGVCFRNDIYDRHGGGVCVYVDSCFPGTLMTEPDIEAVWILVRPFRLPRCVSNILVGVMYHPRLTVK